VGFSSILVLGSNQIQIGQLVSVGFSPHLVIGSNPMGIFGRVTFALGHWQTETQSHSIVVSAWGWLVVDSLRVADPMVGWK